MTLYGHSFSHDHVLEEDRQVYEIASDSWLGIARFTFER